MRFAMNVRISVTFQREAKQETLFIFNKHLQSRVLYMFESFGLHARVGSRKLLLKAWASIAYLSCCTLRRSY
jgi:hypothetical protein